MNQHSHASSDPHADEAQDPHSHWEDRYNSSEQVWSGKVNGVLADVAATLTPGRSLDLGSGEGADVIWLAQQGWQATGVDISQTAVERSRQAAQKLGLDAESVRFVASDLATFTPEGEFDLITASFLHSRAELPRAQILRQAMAAVAPQGHLLITSHGGMPPWSTNPDQQMPTLEEELKMLDLDDSWAVKIAETRHRPASSHHGEHAELEDIVVLVQKAAS